MILTTPPRDLDALKGLVDNPAAPPDVLYRLAADPALAAGLAGREQLPEPVVEWLLAHGDLAVVALLDHDRQTEATRQRIASHPDPEVRHARRNDIEHELRGGSWLWPEDLAYFAGPCGLESLARHQDPQLRAAAARCWDDMPEPIRRDLLVDPDPLVRALATGSQHPPVPADLRQRVLADPRTRAGVAAYAALTAETLRLCLAGDQAVRQRLALNPSLPATARDQLAADPSPYVRAWVLLRQDLPEPARARLHTALLAAARSGDDRVAGVLDGLSWQRPAWLAALPVPELLRQVDSPVDCLRHTAAAALPPEALPALDEHWDIEVRRIAARRPDCPGEVLARLVIEHGESSRDERFLVQHPNFPVSALAELAAVELPRRRGLAAYHPLCPAEVLTAMTLDSSGIVRTDAARHPRLPVDSLVALLADEDWAVRQAAAANPGLPVGNMRLLLERAGL